MTDSQTSVDPSELYAELEMIYTQARWQEVLSMGEQLLTFLQDDPANEALRSRCQLLLGHANLYGLQRPAMARPYYLALKQGAQEPDLRRQAEEALQYCPAEAPPLAEPVAAAELLATTASPPASAAASGPDPEPLSGGRQAGAGLTDTGGFGASAAAAAPAQGTDPFLAAVAAASAAARTPAAAGGIPMPWLADGSEAAPVEAFAETELTPLTPEEEAPAAASGALAPLRLEVEVVEEPELIEVAQADPTLAEELEVELERIRARRRAEAADAAGGMTSPRPGLSLEKEETPNAFEPASPAPQPEPPRPRPVDLSSEDPELVAGLLEVVLQG